MLTKVMQPWLVTGAIESKHPSFSAQPLILMVGMIILNHHADLYGQHCRRALVSDAWTVAKSIKPQKGRKILPDRD